MSKYQVVEGDYAIKPSDIYLHPRYPLIATFGHGETEQAAAFIVRYCQQAGSWVAFTHEELDEAFGKTRAGQHSLKHNLALRMPLPPGTIHHLFCFFDLEDGGMVVRGDDGKYRVTDEFIHRCFRARRQHKK